MQPDPAIAAPDDGTRAVLQGAFDRAATQNEHAVHRIRVVVLLLVLVRLLVTSWSDIVHFVPKHWITIGVMVLGIGVSAALKALVDRTTDKTIPLVVSPVTDGVIAFLVVLPSVLWPRENFTGVLSVPDFGVWVLVAVGSGMRLSVRASVGGSAAAFFFVSSLVALDHARNAALIRYGISDIALAIVLLFSAFLLSLGIASRGRTLVVEAAQEAVRAERARSRLGAYVSAEIAELVLREPEAVLGGETAEIAVLLSDLRGFTRAAEHVDPRALIGELNAYLEAMVPAIHEHGGVVDKYMGDAILVVFGVPLRTGDEASRALRAVGSMHKALRIHNEQRAARSLLPLVHGIGVHHGPVAAGHVGTRERLQFTVIGDTVNVASRLQTATKELGVATVFSGAVLERAKREGFDARDVISLPPITLRGRTGMIDVFSFSDPAEGC